MSTPIQTVSLRKEYKMPQKGRKIAVKSLDLNVDEGVVFGFLGPNGAGKTTTIKMLLDFMRPTSGQAYIYGMPTCTSRTRASIGYLPEQPYFHKFLKPYEIVSMHAALAGMDAREIDKRTKSAIEKAGIADYERTPISKLSKGLTQRVGIAQAIVADPKLLILDEPTSGLDPIGRKHMRDLLLDLKNQGTTIFLSSHLLGEVESICDRIAIMRSGEMAACGKPDEVREKKSVVRMRTDLPDEHTLERLRFVQAEIENISGGVNIKAPIDKIYEITKILGEAHVNIASIETERESLEEAFIRLAA